MNRKVVYARLHAGAYVPGAGELGTTFPSQSKTLENLSMNTAELGLHISFTYRGVNKEVIIPAANVIIMELATDEKPLKVVKSA